MNALNHRLSRLEGRPEPESFIFAVSSHDEADEIREAARAKGHLFPLLIVVTGVSRGIPVNMGTVDAMLERVAQSGRQIHHAG